MLTLLLALCTAPAVADTPVDSLPDDLRARFEAAEAAWELGHFDEADAAYQEVTKAQPSFDRAWRRRCGVMLAIDELELAEEYCREAVSLTASAENRTALAHALLRTDDGVDEAHQLVTAVLAERDDYTPAWVAQCTWAVMQRKEAELQACTTYLEGVAPMTPGTLYFQAMSQAIAGDPVGAAETLTAAREKGLQDDLTSQGVAVIAQANREADARRKRQERKEDRETGAWTLADLVPLLIAGGLILAIGVLAFGDDDGDATA